MVEKLFKLLNIDVDVEFKLLTDNIEFVDKLAPSGTSRDGRVTSVVQVSARQMGRARECSLRCRRGSSPTSPPQDGSGRRRALHMPNSVGAMCQTARGTKQWDLRALTGRPAGGGVGLARSVESM